ncbi:MAG TPA: DUF4193 domain-containing protein [Mycobacterium sp.]|nr:DUF4193 domain-containing protein [Mycobacterium sp.]
MTVDYDAPRVGETDALAQDSVEELATRRNRAEIGVVDADEADFMETFELPGADLSELELSVRVIPVQANEFTCSSCFLVQHRSRLASRSGDKLICADCA